MQLSEIAELVAGEILRGDPATSIGGVAGIEGATSQDLSFYQSIKYKQAALASGAGALLVAAPLEESDAAQIKVDHPYLRFLQVVRAFHPAERPPAGVHPSAVVDPEAQLGDEVSVGPTAVIEAGARVGDRTVVGPGCFIGRDAVIGADCFLHARVAVRERCLVGDRVQLHIGVVVGSDGFGYVRIPSEHVKIPHIGIVRIEDDVEIGANSTIDRGTFGETVIGAGAKIDNLVQVGHNVQVGPRVLLCAQAGISGSSSIGADAVLAGQVGVADHATIGEAAIVTAQSGVATRVKPGTIVSGSPVYAHEAWLKFSAARSRVAGLLDRVRALEKKLDVKD